MLQQILQDFQTFRKEENIERFNRFYKNNGYQGFGLDLKDLKLLIKKYKDKTKNFSDQQLLDLVLDLFKLKKEESIYLGIELLRKRIRKFDNLDFKYIEKLGDYLFSWSTVDKFCSNILQELLIKFEKQTLGLLKKWNKSRNLWKRRASVVAFANKLGKSNKFTDFALNLCKNLVFDKQDLVKKGVGWCLKELMLADKQKVFCFVKDLREQGVSPVIISYAIERLKPEERQQILKIKCRK